MKPSVILLLAIASVHLLSGCDSQRVYENNLEFKHRYWLVTEEPSFEFAISDSSKQYNLYYNVRNSIDYPWDRLFVNWSLYDSSGNELAKKLVYNDLFDPTGRPYGESGIGDLYDHQFAIASHFRFTRAGRYTLKLTQFSRQDTLRGILAVGVRVEQDLPQE